MANLTFPADLDELELELLLIADLALFSKPPNCASATVLNANMAMRAMAATLIECFIMNGFWFCVYVLPIDTRKHAALLAKFAHVII